MGIDRAGISALDVRRLLGLADTPKRPSGAERQWSQTLPTSPDLELGAWALETDDGPIPVWTLQRRRPEQRPLMLYAHAHGGRFEIGKNEIVEGRATLQDPPLGIALARAGYIVVTWDARGFGARRSMVESAWTKAALWRGRSPWGLMLEDAEIVLSWALELETVEAPGTTVLGLSMGALLALWLAAIDARVRVCAELCCLASIDDLIAAGAHDLHAPYFMVPGWLEHGDSLDLCQLIAPRPHFVAAGAKDPLTPLKSLRAVDAVMTELYNDHGRARCWQMVVADEAGHKETALHRIELLNFLHCHLRS